MDYNEYLGRIAIGRVNRGVIRQGQPVAVMTRDGGKKAARIEKLFGFQGLRRVEIEEAGAATLSPWRGSRTSISAKRSPTRTSPRRCLS
ncbi:hypothetical protein HMSSN036_46440 [Paenibacillus macerans]|nr:hypothetical protein HMSSN036_46440 [Paenibacillus macerans]